MSDILTPMLQIVAEANATADIAKISEIHNYWKKRAEQLNASDYDQWKTFYVKWKALMEEFDAEDRREAEEKRLALLEQRKWYRMLATDVREFFTRLHERWIAPVDRFVRWHFLRIDPHGKPKTP